MTPTRASPTLRPVSLPVLDRHLPTLPNSGIMYRLGADSKGIAEE